MRWCLVLLVGCGRVGFDPHAAPPDDAPPDGPVEHVASRRITVADFHSCAIDATGALFCWGTSFGGEVGTGDFNAYPSPVHIGTDTWISITSGIETSCGVTTDGRVFSWGNNGNGDLGLGDFMTRESPTQVAVTDPLILVSSAESDTIGITATGKRWGWGDNRNTGALGTGDEFGPDIDPLVALLDRWTSISMGPDHACGIRDDQTLWCWGTNGKFELGVTDSTMNHPSPTQVDTAAWLAVGAGRDYSCAIRDDSTLWCWGDNSAGQLGAPMANASTPVQIGTQRWRTVVAGEQSTCGIDTSDALWCWGANAFGQLGVGDKNPRATPTQVAPGTTWLEVDINGPEHACGIQADNSVWCWGHGADGRLGTGDNTDQLTPARAL